MNVNESFIICHNYNDGAKARSGSFSGSLAFIVVLETLTSCFYFVTSGRMTGGSRVGGNTVQPIASRNVPLSESWTIRWWFSEPASLTCSDLLKYWSSAVALLAVSGANLCANGAQMPCLFEPSRMLSRATACPVGVVLEMLAILKCPENSLCASSHENRVRARVRQTERAKWFRSNTLSFSAHTVLPHMWRHNPSLNHLRWTPSPPPYTCTAVCHFYSSHTLPRLPKVLRLHSEITHVSFPWPLQYHHTGAATCNMFVAN